MSDHDPHHEEILSALLAEASTQDGEVPEALASCPTCRALWARLSIAPARLRAAAAHERSVLEEAARGGPAPGEERLLATLEHLATSEPPRGAVHRSMPVRRWLVASAALLLGTWAVWRAVSAPERAPLWLGDEAFEHLEPCGEVASFARFAWTYNAPAASFELTIYRDEDGQRGERLEQVPCEQPFWVPEESALARWPERIQWRIQARNAFGEGLGSASASAWLSH